MRAAILCVGLAVAVGCGGKGISPLVGAPVEANIDDVLRAYSANPAAADEKYKDKSLKVVTHSVKMKRVEESTVADYTPIGHMDLARAARFYFASEAEAAKVKPGTWYTITGTCGGLSGNVVVFRDCKAAEHPVAKAPPRNEKLADAPKETSRD